MSDKAILDGETVVPVDDLLEWGRWYEKANRTVAVTVLSRRKHIRVSTVFLGMDHGFGKFFGGHHEHLWFETMIFGTSINEYQNRYADIVSARKGHAVAVGRARQARQLRGRNPKTTRKETRRFLKRYIKLKDRAS